MAAFAGKAFLCSLPDRFRVMELGLKGKIAELTCQFLVFVSNRRIVRLLSQPRVLHSCCQIAFEKCVHGKHHRQFSANVGRVRSVPLNRMASLGAIDCQVLSQRREFRGMRPLFGRFLRTGQVETAIDQGHVSEGLWKVANQPSCPWIVLLAEKAEIIA